MGLTAKAVETAKPRDKAYKLADRDGLYLFVSPAGGKSWRANYSRAGRQKTRTYGRMPDMGLADAREAHLAARSGTADTTTLVPSTPLFRVVAKEWLRKHLPGLSNPKHRGQVESTLEIYAYPQIGDRHIGL